MTEQQDKSSSMIPQFCFPGLMCCITNKFDQGIQSQTQNTIEHFTTDQMHSMYNLHQKHTAPDIKCHWKRSKVFHTLCISTLPQKNHGRSTKPPPNVPPSGNKGFGRPYSGFRDANG